MTSLPSKIYLPTALPGCRTLRDATFPSPSFPTDFEILPIMAHVPHMQTIHLCEITGRGRTAQNLQDNAPATLPSHGPSTRLALTDVEPFACSLVPVQRVSTLVRRGVSPSRSRAFCRLIDDCLYFPP